MDEAHAHPPSPAFPLHVRSRSIPPSLREYQPNQATPKSAPHTRQQKLLQTRHARFSAQRLSVTGIPFSLNRSIESDPSHFSSPRFKRQDENDRSQIRTTEEISNASTDSAILNEISNFNTSRLRGLKRRAAIPVFEDSPEKHSNPPSVYHDASSDVQAFSIPDSLQDESPAMGLREISVNLPRPSPGKDSPHYRSVRNGLRRKSSLAKQKFNSDEYIEHIENELQSVKDAMYSPTTHLPWKEKLKKAKEEIHHLNKEMELMKVSFEFELHETVERSADIEVKLKRRIKDLEDEVQLKQTVIQDLEGDHEEKRLDQTALEVLKSKIERLEEEKAGLEATNRDMTKRNEVLTQLLALSPTKAQSGIELPTPRRRSARPMSLIIPRVPSSPGIRTSQSQSRPQSILTSPPLAATDYFGGQTLSSPLASSPGPIYDTQSIDSGLGESCAPVSSNPGSRRSTLASQVSTSPDTLLGGHVRAESRSQSILAHPSKRRPRKFMPGSSQLKPLLLPTFVADNGNLPSTSPFTSPTRSVACQFTSPTRGENPAAIESSTIGGYGDITCSSPDGVIGRPGPAFQSMDEVFAEDISRYDFGGIAQNLDTPSFSEHWGLHQTPFQNRNIHSSEAYRDGAESHAHPQTRSWTTGPTSIPINFKNQPKFDPLDSLSDADNVDIPQPLFSKHRLHERSGPFTDLAFPDTPLNPRKRQRLSSTHTARRSGPSKIDRPLSTESASFNDSEVQRHSIDALDNPLRCHSTIPERPSSLRTRNPLEILQHRGIGSRPLATLTIKTVYATLSRYTSCVQKFKRDPLALARRVIANAWHSKWKMFGKLSWWVLGLFIGHRPQDHGQLEWDWETYDGESIAHRCCSAHVEHTSEDHPGSQRSQQEPNAPASQNENYLERGDTTTNQPTSSSPGAKAPKDSWGRSLFLWGKFSVAIMLAVGGAIVKGPAEMLRDAEERRRSRANSLADSTQSDNEIRNIRSDGTSSAKLFDHQLPCHLSHSGRSGMTPNGVRKVRSFSSPPTTTDDHHRPPDMDPRASLNKFSSTNQAESPIDNDPFSQDGDTLKPARAERRNVQSIFHEPGNDHTDTGMDMIDPTIISNDTGPPYDQGIDETSSHL